jgi:hypothetical protein
LTSVAALFDVVVTLLLFPLEYKSSPSFHIFSLSQAF